jgi:hypothetical protein
MAFQKLGALLKERITDRPHLKDAADASTVETRFKTAVKELFPEHLHTHFQETVRVVSVRGGEMLLGAEDAQTAALLTLERERIRDALNKKGASPEITKIKVRATPSRHQNRQ